MAAGADVLAVGGERGVDLFQRRADAGHGRARFRCIATLDGGTGALIEHDPAARNDPDGLRALAKALRSDPLLTRPIRLGDSRSWRRDEDDAGGADEVTRLTLYHAFFRAWQIADMAAQRFLARVERDPAALPLDPGQVAGAVVPFLDFNRLSLGLRAARLIRPVMAARIALPGWREPRGSSTGYAMRMLGDLCLRAGDPAEALRCYETGVRAGDNPHRRRRAIEAAHAAGDLAGRDAHIAAFRAQWALPGDLAALQADEGFDR